MLLRENKSFGDQLCKKSMIKLLIESENLSSVYKPFSWTVLIPRPRDDTVSAFDVISILYTHIYLKVYTIFAVVRPCMHVCPNIFD